MNPIWAGEFTSLQKLLILRVLRPEKLIEAIQLFVSEHLGAMYAKTIFIFVTFINYILRFIEAPAFDLPAAFSTSGPTKPIIFLLASGEDPTELIFDFALKRDILLATSS